MNPNVYINALPMATAVRQFEGVLSLRIHYALARHARFGVEEAVECVGGVVGEGVLDLLDALWQLERPQRFGSFESIELKKPRSQVFVQPELIRGVCRG